MSVQATILLGLVWLSLVGLAVAVLLLRQPKRRKTTDELEAANAALRGRVGDVEDRLEHFIKRTAGRNSRENAQQDLPLPETTLGEITRKAKAMGLH